MARTHRPFFAVRPDSVAAARATTQRERVCAAHALGGDAVEAKRLHVTLHWLRDHKGELPARLMSAALAAGARVEAEPFGVGFDCIGSVGGVARPGPLVLTGGGGLKALRALQRAVGVEMTELGLGQFVRTGFRPHISLFYPKPEHHLAAQAIEPVIWEVDELLLIDSHVNEHVHEVLGRWPLRRRQASLAGF